MWEEGRGRWKRREGTYDIMYEREAGDESGVGGGKGEREREGGKRDESLMP